MLFLLNAIDELDRAAFSVLLPEIRNHFGLSHAGILAIVALLSPVAVLVGLPLAHFADRLPRTRIAAGGAAVWGGFSLLSGLAPNVATLTVARAGSGLGKAVNSPTHQSLIPDYYPVEVRPNVFAAYQSANSFGNIVAPIAAGVLAAMFSWRAPFVAGAFATLAVFLLALTLREPIRGINERRAAGADEETASTEEAPPRFSESWRILYSVATLRRLYFSLPLIAGSILGLQVILSLYYEEVFGVDAVGRGLLFAAIEPFQILGLVVGAPIATRIMKRNPGASLRFVALTTVGVSIFLALIAVAPTIQLAFAADACRIAIGAVLYPAIAGVFSLVIPPRARSLGFATFAVWALPGFAVLPIIGGVGDTYGLRVALLILCPMYLMGGLLISAAGKTVNQDIENNHRWSRLNSEARRERILFKEAVAAGAVDPSQFALLDVRDIQFSYDSVQVLFGINLKVPRGSKVALLGTNGAGKSTLLKVISGLLTPDPGTGGSVWFKNEDMTYSAPGERVKLGMVQVGGGRGTFPSLTVEENLRIGAYPFLADRSLVQARLDEVFELFPVLRSRLAQRAGTLSGGEQQMMVLGRALIARPELLMIDELSLGLAPVATQEILRAVEEIVRRGTTLVLVEQSLNVALSMCDDAYFMEKGEIRFSGPTSELMQRGDLVRSVFFGKQGGDRP